MTDAPRFRWWTSPRSLLRGILSLDDTPHSIALGTAIGMFIGMTPTVGLQMMLVVLLAIATRAFFRFNRVAALLTVYISNPVTVVPIYYFDYLAGGLFFPRSVSWEMFTQVLGLRSEFTWWEKIRWLFVEVGAPLVVGSLVVATLAAAATYPAMRWLVRTIRGPQKETDDSAQRGQLAATTSNR